MANKKQPTIKDIGNALYKCSKCGKKSQLRTLALPFMGFLPHIGNRPFTLYFFFFLKLVPISFISTTKSLLPTRQGKNPYKSRLRSLFLFNLIFPALFFSGKTQTEKWGEARLKSRRLKISTAVKSPSQSVVQVCLKRPKNCLFYVMLKLVSSSSPAQESFMSSLVQGIFLN